jgi:hypothetical protein
MILPPEIRIKDYVILLQDIETNDNFLTRFFTITNMTKRNYGRDRTVSEASLYNY